MSIPNGSAKEFFANGNGAFAADFNSLEDGNYYWITDMTVAFYEDRPAGASLAFQIRKDWVDKLGLEIPKTTDELFDVLSKFQTMDANGSGQIDEVISVPIDNFGNDMAQIFGLGTQITHVADETGVVTSPWYHENLKEYVNYMKKLNEAGLIETSGQGSQKNIENKIAGISSWATQTWEEPVIIIPEGEAAAYFLPILVDTGTGVEPRLRIQRGSQIGGNSYSVTDKCKNPEAIAAIFDYMSQPEYPDFANLAYLT